MSEYDQRPWLEAGISPEDAALNALIRASKLAVIAGTGLELTATQVSDLVLVLDDWRRKRQQIRDLKDKLEELETAWRIIRALEI